MSCPKCGKDGISKEKTIRGWSGDYVCNNCGYSDAKDTFREDVVTKVNNQSASNDAAKKKK